MGRLPLEGVRIIDCTQVWGGPYCTTILADLGAETIKLEPPYGEQARGGKKPVGRHYYTKGEPGEKPWNRDSTFVARNRNKLSVCLSLAKEKGKRLFRELARISDVVVDNFAAGVMDRLGVGYDELRKVKPDIIVASGNGYGRGGPWSAYHSYGVIQEPMCGFMSLTGYIGDDIPYRSGVDHIDPLTGIHIAGAIMAALLHRQKTGEGQQINVSMLESGVNFIGPAMLNYILNGRLLEHKGNRHNQDAMAPHGCYRCGGKDDWVTIAIGAEEDWSSFCRAIGDPPWTKERRFSDLYNRLRNQDDLDKLVEAWTIEKDKYEVMHILQKAGVAAGAVTNMGELFSEPHLKARSFWQIVRHAEIGPVVQMGPKFKFSGVAERLASPAPLFAQHTDFVFKELLGLTDAELKQAIEDGIVFTEPTDGKPVAKASMPPEELIRTMIT